MNVNLKEIWKQVLQTKVMDWVLRTVGLGPLYDPGTALPKEARRHRCLRSCIVWGAVLYSVHIGIKLIIINPDLTESVVTFAFSIVATQSSIVYTSRIFEAHLDKFKNKTFNYEERLKYPPPLKKVVEARAEEYQDSAEKHANQATNSFQNHLSSVWALFILVIGRCLILFMGSKHISAWTLASVSVGVLCSIILILLTVMTIQNIGDEPLSRHYFHTSHYPPLLLPSTGLRIVLVLIYFLVSIVPTNKEFICKMPERSVRNFYANPLNWHYPVSSSLAHPAQGLIKGSEASPLNNR